MDRVDGSVPLPSGARMRLTGVPDGPAVVCVNGGTARLRPGDWSTSVEWLVARLAPRHPAVSFYEVRYRIRSWKALGMCIEDAREALAAVTDGHGARPVLLLGYSMGGAVSASVGGHPAVRSILGLAPWLPREIDLSPLRGKRLRVVHGALDAGLPGIPGVLPSSSQEGVERARAAGVEATHELIPRAIHPIAISLPGGVTLPAPRAGEWLRRADDEIGRYEAEVASA